MAQTMLLASSGPFPPPSYVVVVVTVTPSHVISDLATWRASGVGCRRRVAIHGR
jgi:hypothetical protein